MKSGLKEKKKKIKEKKRNTNAYLGKKLWAKFSLELRTSSASFQGYVYCYTCNKQLHWKEAQAGHCWHRGRQSWKLIDYDKEHIRIQCQGCNGPQSGKTTTFLLKLTEELGIEKVKAMEFRRWNELPLTAQELKELITKYAKI